MRAKRFSFWFELRTSVKLGLLCWILSLTGFVTYMNNYAGRPGEASGLERWPSASAIPILPASSIHALKNHLALVTFIHPMCACSRATVENPREIAGSDHHARLIAVVWTPSSQPEWKNSESVKRLREIQKVELVFDESKREFDLFDVKTSGQSFLFASDGSLIFKGGLTESRGHLGPSRGSEFVKRTVANTDVDTKKHAFISSVFGCETNEGN